MPSIFEKLWRIGPAAVVFKAIIVAVAVDALLLMFILLRRTYRARYFARRDARVFEIRQQWEPLIAGDIPYTMWRKKPFELEIIESMALDAFEAAGPEESARLLKFLRTSGLIEKRAFEARRLKGWKRMRALVALGRTRAPEGIPALGEGLRDRSLEIRLAALRGLGRTACPQAAEEILAWLSETGLSVPALPVQSALIQCTAERPQLLLPHVKNARGELRELLGRVLGEVATPSLGSDLLQYAADDLDELRAAAARSMAHTKSGLEIDVLTELIVDPVWFVRLRAAVSLGQLSSRSAAPALVLGLKDANRMVRLRAAEGLVQIPGEMAGIFALVVATQDRYGLHAYLAALENANLRDRLEHELQSSNNIGETHQTRLQKILETGTLAAEDHGLKKHNRDAAIVRS